MLNSWPSLVQPFSVTVCASSLASTLNSLASSSSAMFRKLSMNAVENCGYMVAPRLYRVLDRTMTSSSLMTGVMCSSMNL